MANVLLTQVWVCVWIICNLNFTTPAYATSPFTALVTAESCTIYVHRVGILARLPIDRLFLNLADPNNGMFANTAGWLSPICGDPG